MNAACPSEHTRASEFAKEQDDSLRKFIDQQCQRLQASIETSIQTALPAAASYFLQCQEAHRQGQATPLPPEVLFMARSALIVDEGHNTGPSNKLLRVENRCPLSESLQNESGLVATTTAKPLEVHACTEVVKETTEVRGTQGNNATHLSAMKRAIWELGEFDKQESAHSWLFLAYERVVNHRSKVHLIIESIGSGKLLPVKSPKNMLVVVAKSRVFHRTVALAILVNTVFGTFVADQSVRNLLKDSPEDSPQWWAVVDDAFTIFFGVELLIRLAAFRAWFFVDPVVWKWNVFDLSLVCASGLANTLSQVDVFRFLRIFRVARFARFLRLAEDFTELRKLLFAIAACLYSLFWSAVFLGLTMFIFSLFILQSLSRELGYKSQSPEFLEAVQNTFQGIDGCFETLFVVVAGDEWLAPHHHLSELGAVYSVIIPLFVLFVNIGVMNVVIGVFAEAASRCKDRDMVAQDEMGDVEDFVNSMLRLFKDLATKDEERIGWENFRTYFQREDVQAFLASYNIDASHAHLIYDLCDKDGDGNVDIREFVLGLLRIRGDAKALDQKVLAHAIRAMAQDVNDIWQEVKQIVDRKQPCISNHSQHSDVTKKDVFQL